LALAAVAGMLVQTTVFPALPGVPVLPDLMLVLAVYLGVRRQTVGGAAAAFVLGYFLDTFSGTLLGLNAFALTAAYLAVQWLARHLWFERGLPVMAVVLFGGAVRDLAAVGLAAVVADQAPVWQHVLGYGLAGVLASSLVAPAVFAAVAWEERLLGLS
ncbi:MAG TPA: rod shape-determining protein MreD, partial [Candidatus Binatia bacterium]|nr:rod shape-determining protein MreD [Candidatus Binatia bacterium]